MVFLFQINLNLLSYLDKTYIFTIVPVALFGFRSFFRLNPCSMFVCQLIQHQRAAQLEN